DNPNRDLTPDQHQFSAFASFEQELVGTLVFDLDAIYSERDSQVRTIHDRVVIPVLPASFGGSPFSPFDVPVLVYYDTEELGPRVLTSNDVAYSISPRLRGDLRSSSLKWSIEGTYAWNNSDAMFSNVVDQTALIAAVNDPNPTTAFN